MTDHTMSTLASPGPPACRVGRRDRALKFVVETEPQNELGRIESGGGRVPDSPGRHRLRMPSSIPTEARGVRAERILSEAPQISVAIAGAAGFVGSSLADRLADRCRVVALGRRFPKDLPDTPPAALSVGIHPKRCDLFSIEQTEAALEGVDVAVYLVHSMSPNARLTQGSFEDLDLLLADNFARAASRAGVKRIVYLGGLLPSNPSHGISAHLQSRWEVERALGSQGIPVTAIRAGLVVGAEGSSLNLLVRLVERLPLMVCPSWTSSKTQPIALADVIEILEYCCLNDSTTGRVCEVGGPDVMSYREMMQTTARVLDRKRPMIPVPLVSPGLSELWVSLVTGTPRALVRPLIESLKHPMVVNDPWLQEEMGHPGLRFEEALAESVPRSKVWKRPIARSVQRFVLPPGRDVAWVAREYPSWLGRISPWLIHAEDLDDRFHIRLRGLRRPLLTLERSSPVTETDGFVFRVTGGILAAADAKGDPRLEFRATPDGAHVLTALQDFEPRLPWWIYAITQAPLHRAIMAGYRSWLSRRAREAEAHARGFQARPDGARDNRTEEIPP